MELDIDRDDPVSDPEEQLKGIEKHPTESTPDICR